MRVQLLITQERTNEARWLLEQADELLAGNYNPTLYCYYMYLSTLLNRTEEYIDEMAGQVEKIFRENMDDWRVAVNPGVGDVRDCFKEITDRLLDEGCRFRMIDGSRSV